VNDTTTTVEKTNIKNSTHGGLTWELPGGVLSGDIYLYQATKYTANDTVAGVKVGGVTLNASDVIYVKYGVTVPVTLPSPGITGMFASTNANQRYEVARKSFTTSMTAGTDEGTLIGGYKVELKDVCARSHATSTASGTAGVQLPPETYIIKSGTVIYPDEAYVLDSGAEISSDVTVNTDISWQGMTKVTIASGKTDIVVSYQSAGGVTVTKNGDSGQVDFYVPVGTELSVTAGSNTLKVNGTMTNSADVTNDSATIPEGITFNGSTDAKVKAPSLSVSKDITFSY